jgi:hypothetical protein
MITQQSFVMSKFTPQEKRYYISNDEKELQSLVRKTYAWYETKDSKDDFPTIEDKKHVKYIGIDLKATAKRIEALKKTNLFSKEFLDNYNKISVTLNEQLKSKKIEWFVGELPPFGGDTNAWCGCQDNPEDYWKTMVIKNLKIQKSTANFSWTWSPKNSFSYKVKAVKEDGIWKIAYLEGFNFDELTKI